MTTTFWVCSVPGKGNTGIPGIQVEVVAEERNWLPQADYADSFAIAVRDFHPAEVWAATALEGGTISTRLATQATWRLILGLRLGSLSDPRLIAGWQVIERAPHRVILGARSWQLEARVVFQASRSAARVTTLIRYNSPAAQAIWAVIGPGHRRAVPAMLAATRRTLAHAST